MRTRQPGNATSRKNIVEICQHDEQRSALSLAFLPVRSCRMDELATRYTGTVLALGLRGIDYTFYTCTSHQVAVCIRCLLYLEHRAWL